MTGRIIGGFLTFLFVFSAAGGSPPREIPSVMTLQEAEAYLAGESLDAGLPAETFGYPDPDRVLEWEKQLELTSEQKNRIRDIANGRRREAVNFGKKIVAEELLLDDLFRKGEINLAAFYSALGNRLESIEGWKWRWRLGHLTAYAKTKMALNSDQIKKYHQLRSAAPEGASAR